jgi:hypothetical protein
MKRNVFVVCVCSATRSSGPPVSGKIIKEIPVSVASGTFYMRDPNGADMFMSNSSSAVSYVGYRQSIFS